jgi:CPA2 family monovalent cation:H+ antiporter-2
VGLFIVPRWIRWVVRLRRDETTLVASVGLCFGLAFLAHAAGYSVALGAFLAGALVAEGGAGRQVEPLVRPLRDMFAAIFFVAVGMSIEPGAIPDHWGAILALSAVVLVGKFTGVTTGTFLAGLGTRTAVRAGLSLAQIGEFSFIIAGIGVASGTVRDFIPPVAVAVAAITALSTHWLVGRSSAVANHVDRRLPRALQTYATLYGSWVESARIAARANTPAARIRRLSRFIVLDAVLLATIVAGSTLAVTHGTARLATLTGFDPPAIRLGAVALALAVLFPLLYGIARSARALGTLLSTMAVPLPDPGKADLGLAPRRALRLSIQIGIVLIIGAPLAAVTLPFLPAYGGPAFLGVLLLLLGLAFWRSARDLQGHVRAGATMIVEALARQNRPKSADGMLDEVRKVLPGIGDLTQVTLGVGSPGSGQSLAELNLRGLTGASVVGLRRGDERMVFPSAREHLREGDVLALTGTHEAIAAAAELLQGGDSSERHKYHDATVR